MCDRIMALCELSNDLLFQKIPQEKLAYYVDASLAAGRQAAERFQGREVKLLYEEYGVKICYKGSGKQNFGVVLRGQSVMSSKECSVEVYQDSIAALAEHSQWEGAALSKEQALNVHLAHEFFHVLEYQEHNAVSDRLEPIVSFHLFAFQRKSHILRCSEVAAHSFAKTLLELPFLPNFYDYLYLINTGKMTRAAFDDLTARMAALLQ